MVQSLPAGFYPKIGFKRDSSTHSLLCLTQVKSHSGDPGCSVDDALHVLSGKFSSRTKVWRSVEVLKKNKYIQMGVCPLQNDGPASNNHWLITNAGREALVIAPRNTIKG